MLVCTGSKGVRHGDGVVEVDGVRCVELIDDVCATAALTEQREEYMELVEVVHFFVLLPLLCCLSCARTAGRQTDAERGERARERARVELESAAVLRTGCATRQPRRQRGEEDCAARESSIFLEVRCAIV